MFCIKKKIMMSIIKKRKKESPFNYENAELYTIGNDGDGTQNNSYYFSAHSYEKDESLYARLGLRDNGTCEVWMYYNKGSKIYNHETLIYKQEDSPLKVVKTDRGWNFSFSGILTDNEKKIVNASVTCSFTSNSDAVDFFYHMPTERVCTAIAQDKWVDGYFDNFKTNNSTHYEQGGNINGTITLNGVSSEIDLPCLRDHAFGRRVWGYMNNHLWLAGIDKNCMFNFSMVSYPAMNCLEVGHMSENQGQVEFMASAHYDRGEIVKNEVPKTLELELTTTKNRTVKIYAKLLHFIPFVFENGDYTLNEGIAEFEFDGIKCRGILEIGFNKDTSRFMGGKKISKIRER